MKNDPVLQSLEAKLKLDTIVLPQLQEGITECFVITNRNFLKHRMGEAMSINEIDATTRELAAQVFAENNVTPSYATIQDMRKACQVLDAQLGFEAKPGLLEHHQDIISHLFELAA